MIILAQKAMLTLQHAWTYTDSWTTLALLRVGQMTLLVPLLQWGLPSRTPPLRPPAPFGAWSDLRATSVAPPPGNWGPGGPGLELETPLYPSLPR